MYHYYKRRIRGNQINLHIIYIALEMHLWYTEIMQFIVDFSQGNGGKQMKRTIRKMLAVVLSCVLFTGCGAAQKIDDYATNEGEQKTAEKEETKATEEEKTEEKASEGSQNEEPEKTVIYYVTDEVQQSQYINMFREAGKDAVLLKHVIDSQFISHLEQQDQTIQFKRIDADLTEELREDGEADETTVKTLTEVFRKNLGKDKLEVKVEKLKNEGTAAMITLPEESRRMQDMMKMYNMYGMDPNMFGGQEVLVLNANHPLVRFIAENQGSEHVPVICEQLYDLAMMSHKQLSPEEMTKFVKRSNDILMVLTK